MAFTANYKIHAATEADNVLFNERLSRLIVAHGTKPIDLSRHLGLAAGTVYGWANNIGRPRAPDLAGLASVFGMSIDQLVGRKGGSRTRPSHDGTTADRLAMLMRENRLTKYEMRLRTGIVQKTITAYLAGRTIRYDGIIAIARTFNVSLDWLITGREYDG
jgi:transcriptional regulator with XRE-family HTH domain